MLTMWKCAGCFTYSPKAIFYCIVLLLYIGCLSHTSIETKLQDQLINDCPAWHSSTYSLLLPLLKSFSQLMKRRGGWSLYLGAQYCCLLAYAVATSLMPQPSLILWSALCMMLYTVTVTFISILHVSIILLSGMRLSDTSMLILKIPMHWEGCVLESIYSTSFLSFQHMDVCHAPFMQCSC
jgi:hypothetical protein